MFYIFCIIIIAKPTVAEIQWQYCATRYYGFWIPYTLCIIMQVKGLEQVLKADCEAQRFYE